MAADRHLHTGGMDVRRRGKRLDIETPEGVPISFTLATPADRFLAFLLDVLIILVGLIVTMVVLPLGGGHPGLAVGLLVAFVLRNFYFVWFEQRWQGATPGKRARGLRVIDAHGGQLDMGAVIVRNLTREVEILLPLTLLAAPQVLWPAAPPWSRIFTAAWPLVFAVMPLVNKSHRRVGDLVAGTVVVRTPKPILLEDLTEEQARAAPRALPEYKFTQAQLNVYGIYELQVLENVLRDAERVDAAEVRARVCQTIRSKIGWQGPIPDPEAFLKAFYTAQRAHLEKKMLFGKRRRDKRDRDT
jgi:uncharacterized RDD family membrane protein YckC